VSAAGLAADSALASSRRATTSDPGVVLEASGVAAGWGDRVVVRGVDVTVRRGERVALVGSNGSGKTTLLRVLGGLSSPLAGRVQWRGGPLPRGGARASVVGLVFQVEPPPHFTVRELVTLGLGLDGPPSDAQAKRVSLLLEEEDLQRFADRRCSTLSGGEWQRCAIARALVAHPALLLLDEPTNHLDPARRALLHERLARFAEQAIILATHDLELAAMCDRVVILGDGRALAAGSPSDVLTLETLASALGVRVRRVDDPEGTPMFRILGVAPPRAKEAS
jgi:iron complex transport system ATP-binding protein